MNQYISQCILAKRKRTIPLSLHQFHGILMKKSTNCHCPFVLDDGAIIFRVGFDCDSNYLPTSLGQTIPDFSPQQILTELVGGRSSSNEITIVLNKSSYIQGGKKLRKLQQSTSINKMAIDHKKITTTTTINLNNLKTQQATIIIFVNEISDGDERGGDLKLILIFSC